MRGNGTWYRFSIRMLKFKTHKNGIATKVNTYTKSIKIEGFDSFDRFKNFALHPTYIHRKGDCLFLNKESKTFKSNFWEYRINMESEEWVQTVINGFIKNKIVANAEQFRKISMIEDVLLELYINIG